MAESKMVSNFPNGSTVTATSADGATWAYVVTRGPAGELPPGYPDAFPGATLAP